MLNLPKSTEISKSIFKKNFYLKFNMNNKAQESFDTDVSKITLANEISSVSTSIAPGESVKSFFVVRVQLKKKSFDDKNIILISKFIPQNMLLVLEYENEAMLALYETKLIKNDWQPLEDINLTLQGLNMDDVWSHIVHFVQGGEWDISLSVEQNVGHNIEIENIKKEIEKLEKQIKNEKQPKKKFELVQKLNALKQSLCK